MNASNFIKNSRLFLQEYIITNNLDSLVIGISGGIDSTVSCAIARPVCDELSISLIGRSLPCNSNSNKEVDAAWIVGNAFCTNFNEVSLECTYNDILDEIEAHEGDLNPLQKGNIKARLRMLYLRNVASMHNGIVLDNDNYSEYQLGFWTIGGDSPMDLNLGLHYLWKSEVYDLAYHLAQDYLGDRDLDKHIALIKSIQLTPTDGNGVSNSDCEQFGLKNYDEVDEVLKYVLANKSVDVMDTAGYKELLKKYGDGVNKVTQRHFSTLYKRANQPIMPTKADLNYEE